MRDDAKSRDQLGKSQQCDLYTHFIQKFGSEDKRTFQEARENFIRSLAPYAVVSYILQIKDRHNGNILINNKGHLIHIDFGFIFEISPAGNMKFERAEFKLTSEMIRIIGGSRTSEPFQNFVNLTIRAFLAVRKYGEHLYNMIALMHESALDCFRPDSLKNLRERFVLNKNDLDAAKYMAEKIDHAYNNMNTYLYDEI